jgi:uncharacterized protein YjdB
MSCLKSVTFLTLLIALAGCGSGGENTFTKPTATHPTSPQQLTSITVPLTSGTMVPGSSGSLPVTAHFSDNTTRDVTSVTTWQSSDQSIVTVDATGKISAISLGHATATATYVPFPGQGNAQSVSISIEVVASGLQVIEVAGNVPACFMPAASVQLSAIGHFTDGSASELTIVDWTSSAPQFATVSPTGLLRAVTVSFLGFAPVTVNARSGLVTGTRQVTVKTAIWCTIP